MRLQNLSAILDVYDKLPPKTRKVALRLLQGADVDTLPPDIVRDLHMSFFPRLAGELRNGEEDRVIAYEVSMVATQAEVVANIFNSDYN